MGNLFSKVLNMSMTGSVVILLVMLARLILKKSPKTFSYVLWSVVLFRLLCPVSFSASISVLEVLKPQVVETSSETSIVSYIPTTSTSFVAPDTGVEQPSIYLQSHVPEAQDRAPDIMEYVCWIWAAGASVLILYSTGQYVKLRARLVGAMVYRGNVYLADHIDTPFVMGILSPKIYLPTSVPKEERKFIIAHERHHIRRCDHIIKLLSFVALCLHWFNPLVWVAFLLSGKDMEMSCDEAVIRRLGSHIRADYSTALLRMSTHRRILSGMPLAFGEGDTKGRVLNMSRWKKPKLCVSIICLLLCVVVLVACVVNPEETKNLEEMTRTTGPASVGVENLYFTIGDGYSIEMRESDVQPEGDAFRYEHVIRKGEEIVGGVYKLKYPASNWANYWTWVEDLNVPENVPEERFLMFMDTMCQSLGHHYSLAAFYGKEGVVETVHYFFNADALVYDLWFSMELLSEDEKNQILNTVEFEKTSWDGTLKLELPEGCDFSRDTRGDLIFTNGLNKIGGKRVYKAPEGYQLSEYFSQDFMVALGIPEATDETLGYSGGGSGLGADGFGIEYFSDVPPGERREVHTYHQFFVLNDGVTIYDIWFDLLFVDNVFKDTIISSIEVPAIGRETPTVNHEDAMATIPAASAAFPFELQELPSGVSYDTPSEKYLLFLRAGNVVGGVDLFAIPEGVYDPDDKSFFWLENMGMLDFEDPTLCYIGGMTSGDSGWLAEFASDVPEGTPRTVHRRHIYRVVGNQLCDIWLDMLLLSYKEAEEIASAVRFTDQSMPEAQPMEKTPEDIAFEKTLAVIDAVSEGGCHIIGIQENEGYEGPSGYERNYLYHEGNFLYTNRILTAGENITEVGEYYNRYAMLIFEDEFFTNEGHQGEQGEIVWSSVEPTDPTFPWLGNRVWNRSFVTYIDTLKDETGTCYMFRYDKPYEDSADYDQHYFVNFNFDSDGNFLNVTLQVNLFRDNEFSITESIASMDPDVVNAEIQKEYQRATG